MAIDFDKLFASPPIQYVFVDQTIPNTQSQLAAGAQVFFYKTDRITLKNIYIYSGDPMNPFIVAPNPQVTNAAGRLEQPIYLYPFDEAEMPPMTEELYTIEVFNSQNVMIDLIENWPLNPQSGGGATDEEFTNLAPAYAYDIPFPFNNTATTAPVINEVGN